MKLFITLFIFFGKCLRRCRMLAYRYVFHRHGKKFIFNPNDQFTYENVEVGDFVSIGGGATFLASESKIIIGDKVLFGPNVTIIGGNHNTRVLGKYMYDVHEKDPLDDQDVIIEDDVWVGANVLILKGVKLGRGCVIGGGTVVNRDIPPYAIAAGVPARVIKFRFSTEEILKHEEILYPMEKRLPVEVIDNFVSDPKNNR